MISLKDKTLFVTGASRGIGLAIALRAARDGANIVVAAKTTEPHAKLPGTIHTAAAEIEAAGGSALPIVCDIRDDQAVAEAVAAGKDDFQCLPAQGLARFEFKLGLGLLSCIVRDLPLAHVKQHGFARMDGDRGKAGCQNSKDRQCQYSNASHEIALSK